jgi:hypothetical protein
LGHRVRVDVNEVSRFYVEARLTVDEIAARMGASSTTVLRRLQEIGIPRRRRGPYCDPATSALRTTWSPELAYAVGIIATDGNLSSDGRHLAVSSQDVDLLETVRRCLSLTASITPCSGTQGRCRHIQWSDRTFYDWLLTVGLMPAKSLRLGPLAVPDDFFRDFVRGCIDGDGSIVTYLDRFNTPKNPNYVYDRLYVSIVSASPRFLRWLQLSVFRLRGLTGDLTVRRSPKHHDLWRLRYAKRESFRLLQWMYYAPDIPALRRKRDRAQRALASATWYRHALADLDAR